MVSPEQSACEFVARAYGVKFRVRAAEASLLSALVDRLPPGTRAHRRSGSPSFNCSLERSESAAAQRWRVLLDDTLHSVAGDRPDALDDFGSLIQFEVARRSPRWTFVHAGVVGWHGRAILIPGPSFAGKSMLVRALVQAGATYYSDEYAVLDHRGWVYPFAQPLMHRTDSGTRLRLSIDDLGGTKGTRAIPVGMVAVTRFDAGASWTPVTASPGEGLLALLANTVRAQEAPARVMRTLAKVIGAAPVVGSLRGEAAQTAAELLSRHATWHLESRNIA